MIKTSRPDPGTAVNSIDSSWDGADDGPILSLTSRFDGSLEQKPAATDPANTTAASVTAATPSLTSSWAGVTQFQAGGWNPPDCNIAAGTNNLITVVNDHIDIYTKTGTDLYSQSLNTFFNQPSSSFIFDPRVTWDQFAGRFIVLADDQTGSNSVVHIAVSIDSNPLDGWYKYDFNLKNGTSWLDYPVLGFDTSNVYVNGNYFNLNGGAYTGSGVWAISKSALESGAAATAYLYNPTSLGAPYTDLYTPAHMYGTEAGLNGDFLVEYAPNNSGSDTLRVIRVENAGTGTANYNIQSLNVGNISDAFPSGARQLGTSTLIDDGDWRVQNAVWSNNKLYAVTEIRVDSGSAAHDVVHWFVVDTSNLNSLTVLSQGNIDHGSSFDTYYGNLTVDNAGNMIVGYSFSGPTVYASSVYAVIPSGGTGLADGGFYLTQGQGVNTNGRWGDYSGVSIDPTDNQSFWVFNQHATSSNSWATTVGGHQVPHVSNFWVSEGPSPGINGQENVPPNNQINGAIQVIAVHATDPNVMYVGSVNGGIWKTMNATATSPHWVPLTDNLPSLSIGALEFDPTDPTHQTLIAGIGSTSSYFLNDQFTGVLRSTDGGATWSQLGTAAADLGGENITSVAARGTTLLAAADNAWGGGLGKGLFRTTDSGAHWTLISDGAHGLPNSKPVSDVVGDPLNSNVLYAAVTGASGGIFKSTDAGLTWTNVTSGIGVINSTTVKIELAVHHDASNLDVFAAVSNGDTLSGVFRSVNGGSFAALNVPSGGTQASVHGAIAADPSNPNIAYVGLGGGSSHYLTRIDASKPSGSQITDISGGTFGSPHVDTREMQIDANGNLILGTDGGLFRLPTPTANTGAWSAVVGDMSVFEFHSIAYDHVSHVIMAGAQDNGTLVQQTPGSATWDHPGFGDGGDVVIDDVSLASSGQSIRYFSSQSLGGWTRQVYDSSNHLVSSTSLASIADATFTTPVALNNVDPTRLVVGGSGHIYESKNEGTSLTAIANVSVNGIGFGGGNEMVYGAFQNGVGDPDLIYAASGSNVLRQTAAGGGFTTTSPPGGGGFIHGVTDNPTNWAMVFAIDDNQVFESTNAGTTWVDVTANLTSISAADFRSIEYVHGSVDDALVIGTSSGVFYAKLSELGGASPWSKFGTNLPDVIVYDLQYDSADNVLVAGTMGRGAWLVNGATTKLGIDTGDTTAPIFVKDNPLSVPVGGTRIITSSLLRVDDPDNTHAQLTYTVVMAPSHGAMLKNGAATSTFTQADIDNNVIAYREDGTAASSDFFTFNASDPAGNHTANTPFQFAIGLAKFVDTGDFDSDSDRTGDVLWQNPDRSVVAWDLNGPQLTDQTPIGQLPANWHAIAAGDFNNDGNSDVVLQSDSNYVLIWLLNGTQTTSQQIAAQFPSNWHFTGAGDFNRDGKTDLLWQSDAGDLVMLEMNGTQVIANQFLGPAPPGGHVMAVADFGGDGRADILFQTAGGDLVMWQMNGTQVAVNQTVAHVPSNWHAATTGDFNGDAKDDILLHSDFGGLVVLEMNGAQILVNQYIGQIPGNWHVAGTGDVNGDGKSDVILTSDTGDSLVLEMDGTQIILNQLVAPNSPAGSPPLGAQMSAAADISAAAVTNSGLSQSVDGASAVDAGIRGAFADHAGAPALTIGMLGQLPDQFGAMPGTDPHALLNWYGHDPHFLA